MQNITYRQLKTEYNEYMKKIKAGEKVTDYNIKLCTAYGYALDIIDLSRSVKHYLDVTALDGNKNIQFIIFTLYITNIQKGLSLEENKKDLIKKISAYQLIYHYNFFNYHDKDFCVELYEEKNNLGLKVNKIKLDIYKIVEECVNQDFIYGKNVGLVVKEENGNETEIEDTIIANLERLTKYIKQKITEMF